MSNAAMTRRAAPRSLTQAQVDALCQAAVRAWRQAPGSARRVHFVWQGKRYVVRHTSFRVIVSLTNGTAIASAYD